MNPHNRPPNHQISLPPPSAMEHIHPIHDPRPRYDYHHHPYPPHMGHHPYHPPPYMPDYHYQPHMHRYEQDDYHDRHRQMMHIPPPIHNVQPVHNSSRSPNPPITKESRPPKIIRNEVRDAVDFRDSRDYKESKDHYSYVDSREPKKEREYATSIPPQTGFNEPVEAPESEQKEAVEDSKSVQEEEVEQQETPESNMERRHKEFMEKLKDLNTDFSDDKQKILEAKANHFKAELIEIQQEVHPDYVKGIALLEKERDDAIRQATLYRDYQLECTNRLYQLEKETALEEYMSEKDGLREQMLQQLEEKRKRILDEQENFDLSAGVDGGSAMDASDIQKPSTRKTARLAAKQNERRGGRTGKTEKAAILPFQLKDQDIYEDIATIRRSLPYRPIGARRKY